MILALGPAQEAAAAAAPAAGAHFVYEQCDSALPAGGTSGAVFHGVYGYVPGDNCQEVGGALIIAQGPGLERSEASWALPISATPGGSVEALAITAELCSGQSHDAATVGSVLGQAWPVDCGWHTLSFTGGAPNLGASALALGCSGSCAGGPYAVAHYLAATEADPNPPSVTVTGGTLAAGGTLHGHQTLSAEATDLGGGVAALSLRVNGARYEAPLTPACKTAVVANPSVTGTVALTPSPCPSNLAASWSLDTAQPPFGPGPNLLQVCALDFSTIGPANEGCATAGAMVDNSCPESTVAGGEAVRGSFRSSGRRVATFANGRSALIGGRVVDAAGRPLAGATVCVSGRTLAAGARREALGTVLTGSEGRFAYRLPPGPNREVTFAYRRDARQIEVHLRYRAHAEPSLLASAGRLRNGALLRFRGRLYGPDRRGRVVVLQAGVVGSKRWITFRRATSGRDGWFRAGYRFTSTHRPTTYRFRAVVPEQAGYPWAQGDSRPVLVEVAP
jgi:hypothetical protein